MARIRVDTEELRKSAKDIAASAEAVGKAGDEILAVALSLPSYEGQLSGPARKAGYEIQTQTRDLKAALDGDADSILKSAQAFEEVDESTVDSLGIINQGLNAGNYKGLYSPQKTNLVQFSADSGGFPGVLGWEDNGKTITLWLGKLKLVLDKSKLTPEQLDALQKFKDAIQNILFDILLLVPFGLDSAGALIILLATVIEASITVPVDAVPTGITQIKPIIEFLVIAGSILQIAANAVGSTILLYQLYCDISELTSSWNSLVSSGAVIELTS